MCTVVPVHAWCVIIENCILHVRITSICVMCVCVSTVGTWY